MSAKIKLIISGIVIAILLFFMYQGKITWLQFTGVVVFLQAFFTAVDEWYKKDGEREIIRQAKNEVLQEVANATSDLRQKYLLEKEIK